VHDQPAINQKTILDIVIEIAVTDGLFSRGGAQRPCHRPRSRTDGEAISLGINALLRTQFNDMQETIYSVTSTGTNNLLAS
jgi:hypothetical protein